MPDVAPRLARLRPFAGPALTVGVVIIVDLLAHEIPSVAPLVGATAFLVGLATVVVSVFWSGLRAGFVSAAIFSIYTLRFVAVPPSVVDVSMRGWIDVLVVLVIASSLALVSGYLKRREDRLHAALLTSEREKREVAETSRRELIEKAEELERANRALLAVNEGLESFAYVVSHDLKEPVRAMAALLEDAQEKALDPDVRDSLRVARRSNDSLARLLAGLLEVARASRVEPYELRAIYPIEALEGEACQSRFAQLRAERHARLESSCIIGTPPVFATEEHLCQIIGNLVLNAIRHNDKTSPLVRVRVAPQDAESRMVQISVEDDGPGFDPRVVDSMGRIRPGRPAMIRGGFGLVIVRRAVERLGGSVWLGKSEDLGGAAVHFTLPAAPNGKTTTPERERGPLRQIHERLADAAKRQGGDKEEDDLWAPRRDRER